MSSSEFLVGIMPTLPGLMLFLAGCAFLTLGMIRGDSTHRSEERSGTAWAWGTLAVVCTTWVLWWTFAGERTQCAGFAIDELSRQGGHLAFLAGALIAVLSIVRSPNQNDAEFHSSYLFLLAGLVLIPAATDLTTLYLSLELVSIPTVLLLAVSRRDDAGREATLKYFVLSAFSSAVFLLGASYLFGIAGTTSVAGIQETLADSDSPLARVAVALVLGGLAFRVTAVPFHFYAPDVFAGSSVALAGLMSTLPKIAGMLAIVRLLGGDTLDAGLAYAAVAPLTAVALLTMIVGNCAALLQTGTRRLMAYSSIAHSGYMLLGLAAILQHGGSVHSILAYLAAYAVMTVGIFAGLAARVVSSDEELLLDQWKGLTHTDFCLGFSMTICLLSYIGMPFTAGFWAKLGIFQDVIRAENRGLLVAGVAMAFSAVIGAVYYLSWIFRLNVTSENSPGQTGRGAFGARFATLSCALCALISVVWFFLPRWM